jgi:hypothetical protein
LIDTEKLFDVCKALIREKTSALSDSMKTDDFAFSLKALKEVAGSVFEVTSVT